MGQVKSPPAGKSRRRLGKNSRGIVSYRWARKVNADSKKVGVGSAKVAAEVRKSRRKVRLRFKIIRSRYGEGRHGRTIRIRRQCCGKQPLGGENLLLGQEGIFTIRSGKTESGITRHRAKKSLSREKLVYGGQQVDYIVPS